MKCLFYSIGIIGFGTLHIFPALTNKIRTPRTPSLFCFRHRMDSIVIFDVRIFLKLLLLFLTPDLLLFEFFSRKSTKNVSRFKELLLSECLGWFCQLISHVHLRMKQAVIELNKLCRGADKSLARPGRKQTTFPAFYGIWRFITTFTRVHHLSLP